MNISHCLIRLTAQRHSLSNSALLKARQLAALPPFKQYAVHFALLFAAYHIFELLRFLHGFPNDYNLISWDGWWYSTIRDYGYRYLPGKQCNVAFYPLFPYMWRLLHVNATGISIINLALMLSGFTLLKNLLRIEWRYLLLFLSTPSLFFCYVPYSEALFFIACAILLYGMEKSKMGWAIVGMLIACLSRSAAVLLIPAVMAAFMLNYRPRYLSRDLRWAAALIFTAIAAIGSVQLIQWWQTGYLFKSYEVQKYWGRELNFPDFFLTTWGGQGLLWLDGLAFAIGVMALLCVLVLLYRKLKNHTKAFSSAFIFCCVYLVLVTLVAISSSPISSEGGTSIFSLNRFIFATPFFPCFIIKLFRHIKIGFNSVFAFLCIADAVGLLFGAFTGTSEWLYWTLVTLYAFAWLLMSNKKIMHEIWLGIYVLNLILQVYLFNCFINGSGTL